MTNDIESRLAAIEARNKHVDDNKAWEVSWTRRVSIMLLTYVVIVSYLSFVGNTRPWLDAIVPVVGFTLSTLTVSLLKSIWLRNRQ